MRLKEDINYSLWCDFIERDFLENKFQDLIKNNIIQGATSNPSIFELSITKSIAYKQQLDMLQANNEKTIYEEIVTTDIKRASYLLDFLHQTNSDDGFISIEVDPFLCDDASATIDEGLRLYNIVNADNVMIKIPATQAGYIAMKELTSRGINVNATLIFSPQQAIEATKAVNEGIIKSNKDIKAVISVFVSRFDRMLNNELISKKFETSKLGIMNATKCYHEVNKFENNNIRTLFASTGVKGNDLDSSYYIDSLIYPNSINTAPLETIEKWLENGSKRKSTVISEDECDKYFISLQERGIEIEEAYSKLLNQGLETFKNSFKDLLSKLKY